MLEYYEYSFDVNILKADNIHESASLSLEFWDEFINMEDQSASSTGLLPPCSGGCENFRPGTNHADWLFTQPWFPTLIDIDSRSKLVINRFKYTPS
jgi:hypothetical protein